MAQVVIFGCGQWAELAHFYLTHDSAHDVVGFTVDRPYLTADAFKGLPLVPFDEIESRFPPASVRMFIPMSFKKMNRARAEKFDDALRRGYDFISYVSSKATTFPGFTCGRNCFILEDNTIQPFVTIGDDVMMWSGNHIGHHTTIGDHVTITSHVVISGCCRIEPFCFFGVNATIRDETVIARETLVGMGATIVKDTKECEIYRADGTAPSRVRSDRIRSLSHKSAG